VTDITSHLESLRTAINKRLQELVEAVCEPDILRDAINYSIIAGGKRLRPSLCLLTAEMFGDPGPALDLACAIEMIHTYSLIHDDLPAMDNDDLRRGKPTNHIVFGEAYAILAGDGLLNSAFEIMLRSMRKHQGSGLDFPAAIEIIVSAAGTKGMIAGQAADMGFEGSEQDKEVLEYIHERKTAALIKASVTSGAVLMGADSEDIAVLETYGGCIGFVFQIVDDILDEVGIAEKLGKTPGKDAVSDKQTFARLYGIEGSKKIARKKTDEAVKSLWRFGPKANDLKAVAEYLLSRKA
jgi:geranylgeranyl diphosphate synthase type II